MCCNTLSPRLFIALALMGLTLGLGRFAIDNAHAADNDDAEKPSVPAVLDFEMNSIEGQPIHLSQYHGQVVLIVNTASRCGLTKQYKQLQKLHDEHADKGLSILGFPANNFGKQEPGTDEQINEFCEKNYGVQFDMFAKVSVKGEDQAPLYAFLTSEETNPQFAGKIRWNFDKFLISREGKVVARFEPRTKPDAKEVLEAIQAELDKPVPAAAKKAAEARAKAKAKSKTKGKAKGAE